MLDAYAYATNANVFVCMQVKLRQLLHGIFTIQNNFRSR